MVGCSKSTQEQNGKGKTIGIEEQKQNKSKSKNNYPVNIKVYTDEGKEIVQTIEKEPKRVVIMGQSMAELMIKFGLQDKVVGVGYLDKSFSKYEDEISKMPIIAKSWPSKEAIIALKPDIIYSMSSAFKGDRVGDISFWNDRGIPVLPAVNFTIGRSIDEYFKDIKNFGLAFNIENETNKYLKEQNDRMDKVKEVAKKSKNYPKCITCGKCRT